MFSITSLNFDQTKTIQDRIDQKIKPIGSLGQLEILAKQLALIQQTDQIVITAPHLVLFAADHGITQHGVSLVPSAVTRIMVEQFLQGNAAINCFCNANNMALTIADTGLLNPLPPHSQLINYRLGNGTQDFSEHCAMSESQLQQGLKNASDCVQHIFNQGCNTIGFGEMGIGNTSSASAIMALALHLPIKECIGRGTGIDDDQLLTKHTRLQQAIERHRNDIQTPYDILQFVGGFEIVHMVGGMLKAAELGMVVLIDGFIASSAALLAIQLYPQAADYFVYCHRSQEHAHAQLLEALHATPLLDLGLRLGEGSGAPLALPLLRSACAFYNTMASFQEAGIRL